MPANPAIFSGLAATAIRGIRKPPRLCPRMKTRPGAIPLVFSSRPAAARASSIVSSLTVIVASSLGSARIFFP